MPKYSRILGRPRFLPNSEQYEREKYGATFHDPQPLTTVLIRLIPGLILVPLRCLLFILILIPASFSMIAAMVGHKGKKPLKGIRKVIFTATAKTSARLLLFATGVFGLK
eukprot:gnl/Chilomastix_caulleri/4510.p1 GENE.gnl/Chilomastix_caulleri/4510~~gnl/Chilomastix_caulleri/4510.p1  ORF type:complete len:110 (+),score=6.86 gnl/Chilomastix_caulleri/4510:75-404(+)